MILVSHDMHLLSMVADRLWLVSDGGVKPFDDDLEAYRRLLLSSDKPAKSDKPKPAKKDEAPRRATREKLMALRAEVRKCEDRVEKITDMHGKLSRKLADPAIYDAAKTAELAEWNRKFAEVEEGLKRAEALWMAALEKLEKVGG